MAAATRRMFVALAAVAALAGAPGGAAAQQRGAGDPVFTVTNIPVDATAKTPLEARDKALLEGEKGAFEILVRRLVATDDVSKVGIPTDAEIEQLILGFEFAGERTTANRYIAQLSVAFSPDRMKAYLRAAGVNFIDSSAPPVLALPLTRSKAGVAALDERTPWREAWAKVSAAGGLVPMPAVRGDGADAKLIDPEQAFVGDVAALGRLAQRYGTRRILVSVATGEAEGPFAVTATLYDLGTGDKSTVPPQAGVALDKLVDAAVKHRLKLEDEWKSVAAVSRDFADVIVVTVPIKGLDDWVKLRRRIQTTANVREIQVQSLEQEQAVVRIAFVGTREQFNRALRLQGLAIVDGAAGPTIVGQ
ncbi:MAG: DUF2066 domain-containing protein [Rhodospirillales bacterium]|nr:MAG: DUF2066 domain-containing protein [Rhodospirillales bacterium]